MWIPDWCDSSFTIDYAGNPFRICEAGNRLWYLTRADHVLAHRCNLLYLSSFHDTVLISTLSVSLNMSRPPNVHHFPSNSIDLRRAHDQVSSPSVTISSVSPVSNRSSVAKSTSPTPSVSFTQRAYGASTVCTFHLVHSPIVQSP